MTTTPTRGTKRPYKRSQVEKRETASIYASTIHYSMETINLQNLLAQWNQYGNFPRVQRDFVWNLDKQKGMVDTAMRWFPTLALLVYREPLDEGGKSYFIDGLQRITSLRNFYLNKFRTFTQSGLDDFRPNSRLPLIEPFKLFKGLDPRWQQVFLLYPMHLTVISDFPDEWLPEIFFRLQIHSPLSLGETLFISNSATTKAIQEDLYHHNFWSQVYNSRDDRKERVTEALSILGMEVVPGGPLIQLRKPDLLRLAAGKMDPFVTPLAVDAIKRKMTRIGRAFHGAGAGSRAAIIAIWQAGCLLEEHGYDLDLSRESCLVPWFHRIVHGSLTRDGGIGFRDRVESEFNVLAHLPHKVKQEQFWRSELPYLLNNVEGLVKKA